MMKKKLRASICFQWILWVKPANRHPKSPQIPAWRGQTKLFSWREKTHCQVATYEEMQAIASWRWWQARLEFPKIVLRCFIAKSCSVRTNPWSLKLTKSNGGLPKQALPTKQQIPRVIPKKQRRAKVSGCGTLQSSTRNLNGRWKAYFACTRHKILKSRLQDSELLKLWIWMVFVDPLVRHEYRLAHVFLEFTESLGILGAVNHCLNSPKFRPWMTGLQTSRAMSAKLKKPNRCCRLYRCLPSSILLWSKPSPSWPLGGKQRFQVPLSNPRRHKSWVQKKLINKCVENVSAMPAESLSSPHVPAHGSSAEISPKALWTLENVCLPIRYHPCRPWPASKC